MKELTHCLNHLKVLRLIRFFFPIWPLKMNGMTQNKMNQTLFAVLS